MLFLEYFVLIRLYDRDPKIKLYSLFIVFFMSIISVVLGRFIFKKYPTITQIFFVIMYMELPFSLYGYKLEPNASILERMIVSGVFGAYSYALSEAILSKKPFYKFNIKNK